MDDTTFERSQFLILVADDDPALASLVREILSDEGYDTTCCFSGAAALRAIEQDMPHLAILDLQMEHDLAGFDVLQRLRRADETAHLPVILCTAAVPKLAALNGALAALRCVTLPKPFNIDDLLGKVESLLQEPGAGAAQAVSSLRIRKVGQ